MKAHWDIALPLVVLISACGDSSAPPHTAAVIVAPSSLTIDEGSTGTLTAVVTLSDGQPASAPAVAWLSANPSMATVTGSASTATITGVSVGQTSVTATSGGVSGSATIVVRQPPAARVTVSLAVTTIVLKGTTQASATVFDSQGRSLIGRQVVWSSSNAALATVGTSGLVTGVSKGTTFIRATVEGRSDSALVTVLGVASVVASPDTVLLPPRGTATATALVTADPGIPTTVLWSSSSPTIATVSATGVITAVGPPGTAVVRAQSQADLTKYDSVRVTVFDPCARPTAYTLGNTVTGSIDPTDCAGTTDEFEATVTTPTLYRVSVTSPFPFSLFPYYAIPTGLFFSQPAQAAPAYAFVPAGTLRIRIVSSDTTRGRTYTVSSVVEPTEAACSMVMARGLSRAFGLLATCIFNLGGSSTVTARGFNLPAPTSTSGPLVIRANAAGYAVHLELRQAATILASITATAAGQDAVLTYSTQGAATVLTLLVTGPAPTTTGPFTLTINP